MGSKKEVEFDQKEVGLMVSVVPKRINCNRKNVYPFRTDRIFWVNWNNFQSYRRGSYKIFGYNLRQCAGKS